jgi:hypothetical protein
MELETAHKKILEYLQKHGAVNTFRLSRHLKINRSELIDIIEDLAKERLIKFKHGSVSINEEAYPNIEKKEESKETELKGEKAVETINQEFERLIKKSKVPKKKKEKIKKVKLKKKARKIKAKRKRLGKEKELDHWNRLWKLELEKLKIDIKLLSLSHTYTPEDISKLRESIAKLKDMINHKIREI